MNVKGLSVVVFNFRIIYKTYKMTKGGSNSVVNYVG